MQSNSFAFQRFIPELLLRPLPLRAVLPMLCLWLVVLCSSAAFAMEAVDINQADAPTIAAAMTGVGVAKAQAIVDYRQAHGPFKSLDDLLQVKGIGEKTLAANRDRLQLGAEASTKKATP